MAQIEKAALKDRESAQYQHFLANMDEKIHQLEEKVEKLETILKNIGGFNYRLTNLEDFIDKNIPGYGTIRHNGMPIPSEPIPDISYNVSGLLKEIDYSLKENTRLSFELSRANSENAEIEYRCENFAEKIATLEKENAAIKRQHPPSDMVANCLHDNERLTKELNEAEQRSQKFACEIAKLENTVRRQRCRITETEALLTLSRDRFEDGLMVINNCLSDREADKE